MNCRHCSSKLDHTFLDLGFAPPSNAYLSISDLTRSEKYYPLKTKVCSSCWLVQTEDYTDANELFSDNYAYFSSTSISWLAHAESYSQNMIELLKLNRQSYVIEIASNDGYLLKNFVASDIPCLGIEPTASTATAAEIIGIPVLREFFGHNLGMQLASNGQQADLIIGNNVYAHVPDINDFTRGLKAALKPNGTITLEFPHLMRLIELNQFDTIYHEHFSYLSLYTVDRIFKSAGLRIWDVEELPTHGGSLRIFGCHEELVRSVSPRVEKMLVNEAQRGLQLVSTYQNFQINANSIKNDFLAFLIEKKRESKTVVGYGAAAKGNTFLNYSGVKADLLPYIFDAAIAKQGKYMPGSHIPIHPPSALLKDPPDYLVILPWNIAAEVRQQNVQLIEMGTKFVTAVPKLEII